MNKKYSASLRRFTQCFMPALLSMSLVWTGADARAAGQPEELAAQCPGASAWFRVHPQDDYPALVKRDAARSFSAPQLRSELAERFERDQVARKAMLAAPHNLRVAGRVAEVDRDNVTWLWKLVRTIGFPDVEQVGEIGVHQAWLLAQHADKHPRFQAELLPVLEKRHAEGQLDGMTLSRFVDRVLVAQRQPQRYGTQFSTEAWATAHFGLPDEQSARDVDRNRQALGIMPLADYVCMMRHARMKTS